MIATGFHHKAQCKRPKPVIVPEAKGVVTWKCPGCGALSSKPRDL